MGILGLIAQTAREMESNVYNFTKDGKCSHCGNCCSTLLPVTKEEYMRIHNYVVNHHIKECVHAMPFAGQTMDLTCPFLDMGKKVNKCRIYPVRPLICRSFICDSRQRPEWPEEELRKKRDVMDMRQIYRTIERIKDKKK